MNIAALTRSPAFRLSRLIVYWAAGLALTLQHDGATDGAWRLGLGGFLLIIAVIDTGALALSAIRRPRA